jgi:hypothetical protein
MRNRILLAIGMTAIITLTIISTGCASVPGTVPDKIIEQSSAVDTSISQLQSAQNETTSTVEHIDATQQEITAATKASSPDVVALVTKQTAQIKKLKENRAVETTTTTGIQSNWSLFKITTNKVMVSDSSQLAKMAAQLKLAHKWIWILAGTLAAIILAGAAITVIKLYFKK